MRISADQIYRTLFRSMPFGIALIDEHGAIQEFNPAAEQITGYRAAEVEGNPHCEVLHGTNDLAACPLSWREGMVVIETAVRDKSGSSRSLMLTSAPFYDAADNFAGGLEFFRDLTDARRVEQERSNFLSMLAHDMRGPVVVMGGFLGRLEAGKAGPVTEQQRADLKLLIEESARLEGMLDRMLDAAKYRVQTYRPIRRPEDLKEIIDKLIHLLQEQARSKNITVQCACPIEKPIARVDALMIERVVANLLDNAVKYTEPHGTVLVTIGDQGNKYVVEIADTGKGILESELPYIFDVFHRASGEGKGLGLGLAIVKQIMDAHGEQVAVRSIPGQGTVFRLSFPKA